MLRRAAAALVLLAAVVVIVAIVHGPAAPCSTSAPRLAGRTAAQWLTLAIEQLPCASTGRIAYSAYDSGGAQLGALDPIDDPRGGYLGVYHSPTGPSAGAGQSRFAIMLGHSRDLIHWTRIQVLDPSGATDPTLRAIPGAPGYLLAYEKRATGRGVDVIGVRYYADLTALLAGRVGAETDLPLVLSTFNDGTPSLQAIDWRGSPARSAIALGFHYETARAGDRPGNDREALGVLRGLRHLTAEPDRATDALLDRAGLAGSHGDRRQFTFAGHLWRVYEAQARGGDYGSWHVLLDDVAGGRLIPLSLRAPEGTVATSFGNPTAQLLRAPSGRGAALVVTMFVFGSGGAAASAGELVYWQPVR